MMTTAIFQPEEIKKTRFVQGTNSVWLEVTLDNATIIVFADPTELKNRVLWAYEAWKREEAYRATSYAEDEG